MGNSQPKHKKKKSEKDGEAPKMREQKKGPARQRPASEGANIDPEIDFTQFTFGNKPSNEIGGKPRKLPVEDYQEAALDSNTPTGAQITLFDRALDNVIAIWPEYSSLKEIVSRDLSADILTQLTIVANRLCEQHNALQRISSDFHELKQVNEELQEERDSKAQLARKREVERNGLREDIALLRGELKKRGLEPKLPNRIYSSSRVEEVFDDLETMSPRSDRSSDFDDDHVRGKKKGGIYAPTPLLLAEGDKSEIALKRATSLRTSSGPKRYKENGSDGTSIEDKWANASDELKHRVNSLEMQLERERKEKVLLQERLEAHIPGSKRLSMARTSEIYQEEFISMYRHLQRDAFDRVRRVVHTNLPHVPVDKQLIFICSIMELSYKVAKERHEEFMTTMETLLLSPVKPISAIKTELKKPRRTGSTMDNVRKIELANRHGLNRQYEHRSSSGHLPEALVLRLTAFIGETADATNVAPLTSAVVDELQSHFPQCLTPTLLNQSAFTSFLHDCCRFAWRMVVVDPPYHVSRDSTRFEKRYHETDVSVDDRGQEIEYFLWPTLFSRKHGEVLNKGLVQLK